LIEYGLVLDRPARQAGFAALNVAAENGYISIARYLLDNGLSASRPNRPNVLSTAARRGDVEFVQQLLDRGMWIDFRTDNNPSALAVATEQGHYEIVALLLERGAKFKREDGELLRAACEGNYFKIVKEFLKYGVNVNAGNGYALFAAVPKGDIALLELLFEHGIDVAAHGGNALDLAKECGREDVYNFLVKNGVKPVSAQYTRLNLALKTGNIDAVARLMAEKVDPNINGPLGRGVRFASRRNQTRMVELLIRHGASLELETDNDLFKSALAMPNFSLVRLLVINGAPVGLAKSSILRLASSRGDLEVVKKVMGTDMCGWVDRRIDPDFVRFLEEAVESKQNDLVLFWLDREALPARNESGLVCLIHSALEKGCFDIAKSLMTHGVHMGQQNCGHHALVAAAYSGQASIIEFLLDEGHDVSVLDCGYKALLLACYKGHRSVVDLLLSRGVFPSSDETACTPLYWAIKGGNGYIEEVLIAAGFKAREAQNAQNQASLEQVMQLRYADAEKFAFLPPITPFVCVYKPKPAWQFWDLS
jgi:ankyrin repeat protein